MFSPRNQIIELVKQGAIPVEKTADALAVAGVAPDGPAWRRFIDGLLLWLGGLALAFAVLFFTAYNWQDIGRFAKFGMVEAAMVLGVGVYWKCGDGAVAGKVALLAATILLGVLLATDRSAHFQKAPIPTTMAASTMPNLANRPIACQLYAVKNRTANARARPPSQSRR